MNVINGSGSGCALDVRIEQKRGDVNLVSETFHGYLRNDPPQTQSVLRSKRLSEHHTRSQNAKPATGWRLVVLLVLMFPLLSACDQIEKSRQIAQSLKQAFAGIGTTALVWDEEVPLHDGSVIVIKRREVKSGGGFPINSMNKRGITRSYEFCYPPMGLYWKSKGGPRYQPEILEIVEGKAYVKVPISGPESCMFHDYPETNAIYFVWEDAAWKKIPYEAFPPEIRRTNLLQSAFGIKPEKDARGLVTVFQKEQRDQIYGAMRRTKGRIQSRTDFPHMQDECERQRGGVRTTRTPEVFLSPTPDFCQ